MPESIVTFQGRSYAALDGEPPESTSVGCQDNYLPIPAGWTIAPDTPESIAVIAMYPWGTHVMVVDGSQYNGADYHPPGREFHPGSSLLLQSGDTYKPGGCQMRILITRNAAPSWLVDAGARFNGLSQCQETRTMVELGRNHSAGQNRSQYTSGGLGSRRTVRGSFEIWICVSKDSCLQSAGIPIGPGGDDSMCYVGEKRNSSLGQFVWHPWGPNSELQLCHRNPAPPLPPADLTVLSATHPHKTFELFYASKTWHEAEAMCVQRGGHLAMISDQHEQDLLASNSPSSFPDVWIGFNDQAQEGVWRWAGAPDLVPAYTNFQSGQPNADGDCSPMWGVANSWRWRDTSCGSSFQGYWCSRCTNDASLFASNCQAGSPQPSPTPSTGDCSGGHYLGYILGDPSYVDAFNMGGYPPEFNHTRDILLEVQHNLVTASTVDQWVSGLMMPATTYTVVPELERGDLLASLSSAQRNAIVNFVDRGGAFIIALAGGSREVALLNGLFGFSISGSYCASESMYMQDAARSTCFGSMCDGKSCSTLGYVNAVQCVSESSLLASSSRAKALWKTSSAQVAVFEIPVGNSGGRVVGLAADYFAFTPEWAHVLQASTFGGQASNGTASNTSGVSQVSPCTGCTGCGSTTGTSWTISDGSWGGNYPDNANCEWIFNAAYSSAMVTFNGIDTESCCDFIRVYSCSAADCSNKTLQTTLKGQINNTVVYGTTNVMMVKFTTDGSVTRGGFSATFGTTGWRRNSDMEEGGPIEFAALAGGQLLAQAAASDSEVMTIDGEAGATLSIQDALVVIPAGAFVGPATVTASFSEYSEGTSRRAGGSRSSIMKFKVDSAVVSSLSSPVEITMNIPAGKAALPMGSGNKLYLSWLNKVTNEWTSVCGESSLDSVSGDFTTKMPPAVLNDPAFNPSSGCAIDLIGPCDGSGGEFTVFELPKSSCA